jgi:hypothetical protein
MSVEAQVWEQEKDGQIWLAMTNDLVRGLEEDIRAVLKGPTT